MSEYYQSKLNYFIRTDGSDLFIILRLVLCPITSLCKGISYIKERRKRRYVFRSKR
ncbi:small membrane protein [Klebsiella sp. 10982]|uniref:small membrane protein n=1 Tax=Klebsiella TaxID=570 RepID=UPI00191C6044|nr:MULTISPECIES: small membrane protein [Klebsiella]MDF2005619.1 small membrane protein [Klebsiella quasivariicola]MDK7209521.1 small membrane protein [Klebsiella quasivariicola]MEA1148630.1 small membrane protein [Klebsiella pneumoniae]UDC41537.1 small membrane protein [Klebsiella quasivariicola]